MARVTELSTRFAVKDLTGLRRQGRKNVLSKASLSPRRWVGLNNQHQWKSRVLPGVARRDFHLLRLRQRSRLMPVGRVRGQE
jgi:hypothetical protein